MHLHVFRDHLIKQIITFYVSLKRSFFSYTKEIRCALANPVTEEGKYKGSINFVILDIKSSDF